MTAEAHHISLINNIKCEWPIVTKMDIFVHCAKTTTCSKFCEYL